MSEETKKLISDKEAIIVACEFIMSEVKKDIEILKDLK